jgi:hypothetical protein
MKTSDSVKGIGCGFGFAAILGVSLLRPGELSFANSCVTAVVSCTSERARIWW